MNLPTPYTLGVKRWSAGGPDAHGNAGEVFADPANWHVHAVAPGAMDEPTGDPHRDLSVIAFTVYAPVSDELPTERDRVLYAGVEYEVIGRPKDFSNGPWDHPEAGVTVELKATEG